MLALYRAQGYSEDDASTLVEIKSKNQEGWLDEMMVHELGLLPDDRQPVLSAVATFGSFLVAGSVPLLAYLLGLFVPINLMRPSRRRWFFRAWPSLGWVQPRS
jgi:VIT1/CCC1 family predicted Fe2+/Mn2+ transporter